MAAMKLVFETGLPLNTYDKVNRFRSGSSCFNITLNNCKPPFPDVCLLVKKDVFPSILLIVNAMSSLSEFIRSDRFVGLSQPDPLNLQVKISSPPYPGSLSDEKNRLFSESRNGKNSFPVVLIFFPRFSGADHFSPSRLEINKSIPPIEPSRSEAKISILPSNDKVG